MKTWYLKDKFKDLVEYRGMNYLKLEKLTGISRNTLARIQSDETGNPRDTTLKLLSKALNVFYGYDYEESNEIRIREVFFYEPTLESKYKLDDALYSEIIKLIKKKKWSESDLAEITGLKMKSIKDLLLGALTSLDGHTLTKIFDHSDFYYDLTANGIIFKGFKPDAQAGEPGMSNNDEIDKNTDVLTNDHQKIAALENENRELKAQIRILEKLILELKRN